MMRESFTFRGIIAPVFAPFEHRTMKLDLSMIPYYAEYLKEEGITGVLVNGTSGEGMSMSVSERKQVAEAWAMAVKTTKQHLMIQVGGAPLPDVLELAKHAEQIKADSILCLPELYFKPTDIKQLKNYLKIVGEAAPNTPLLYYHIPWLTNVNIHMGDFLKSINDEIKTFVGIKFTSANLDEGAQAFNADSRKFVIFLGCDNIMSAASVIGIDSFIATSVNIFPHLAIEILNAGKSGNILKARESQEKLSKNIALLSKHGDWVVTQKTAMNLLMTEFNVGPVRFPLCPLSDEAEAIMKKDLKI
ncbi:hypothetical protein PV327_000492 [Microctonus hyperodae]|uniref:N-acetylneuraminate lyase n=1 Tax=Microctonus hyperodae TaxID=165561 RepID=A0AA39G6Q4_MICHY|nr:hypothetical protein PV327_000492 [Microctonus hyperodae]